MKKLSLAASAAVLLTFAGCATVDETATTVADTTESAAKSVVDTAESAVDGVKNAVTGGDKELYEVHHDGRIYIFYDRDLYATFIDLKHTAYSFNRIGDGPNGETLVFGLTGDDKKKTSGIPSVELYDGSLTPDNFYGEMLLDGRIYVFDAYPEMEAVRKNHEAAYRLTDIGAGPNGETVVYVLTSENKKKRPEALIAKFKSMHGMK